MPCTFPHPGSWRCGLSIPSICLLSSQLEGWVPSRLAFRGGLTMQQALVRVRTQGWSETPTPENHGLAPQEVSSEACVQLPR